MALPADWRVVYSLIIMGRQLDTLWPDRSHASDGTVADAAHSTTSDHYPHYVASLGTRPVVTARDITHDPAHSVDCGQITEALRLSRDGRLKYVIWNRRIFSNPAHSHADTPWVWRPYTGSDPHTNHAHVSVLDHPVSDQPTPWTLTLNGGSPMSARSDAIIVATNEGLRNTSEGDRCYNTDRRLADEEWQRTVTAKLDGIATGEIDYDLLAGKLAPIVQTVVEDVLSRLDIVVRPSIP